MITFETDFLSYTVGEDARSFGFRDRRTGQDYALSTPALPWARLKQDGLWRDAVSAARDEDRLVVQFAGGAGAEFRVVSAGRYLTAEVLSVSDESAEELCFANMRLSLRGEPDEPFAACALALNLRTRAPEMPGFNHRLRAACFRRFGLKGAAIAVIGCPAENLRDILKEVLAGAAEMPHSPLCGPWALDAEINRGSYLFNYSGRFGYGNRGIKLTPDELIAQAETVGFNQINFVAGLRYGDYAPDTDLYPAGLTDLKAVVDRLHQAGLKAGLHTFSFFIDKTGPFVTPVPDRRLATDTVFALTEPVTPETNRLPVQGSAEELRRLDDFLSRDFAVLKIGDELVHCAGVSRDSAAVRLDVRRGALGTRASAHPAGTPVSHLAECFGYFAPDGDSALFTEIASRIAAVVNDCGFDLVYFDALDGGVVYGEHAWHYESKFVHEVCRRLNRPISLEMATFHHHLWCVRSRVGAWDLPVRGYKRFIDAHVASNERDRRMFMPGQLGWWRFNPSCGFNISEERTFTDDIEYLCGKALATDNALSLIRLGANPRLHEIIRNYERLRLAGVVSRAVKDALAVPGREFRLVSRGAGYEFQRMAYDRHKIEGTNGWSNTWTVSNDFARQPLQARLELLFSAQPYEEPGNLTLLELTGQGVLRSRPGPDAEAVADKEFRPPVDMSHHQGLGVWVYGDGRGEILNFQLRNAMPVSGVRGEHYVTVDFTSWRYFELIEPEGDRFFDYRWPYRLAEDPYLMKNLDDADEVDALIATGQHIYRAPYHICNGNLDYHRVQSLSVWYNNLPAGRTAACRIRPVKAIPIRKMRVRNPALTVGGQTLVFPVEMETGQYLEFFSPGECFLYGDDEKIVSRVAPRGAVPVLNSGVNQVSFQAENLVPGSIRAHVTVIRRGEYL